MSHPRCWLCPTAKVKVVWKFSSQIEFDPNADLLFWGGVPAPLQTSPFTLEGAPPSHTPHPPTSPIHLSTHFTHPPSPLTHPPIPLPPHPLFGLSSFLSLFDIFLWIIHGWSMDNPWIIHGSSMDNPWIIHGSSMDSPWIIIVSCGPDSSVSHTLTNPY